MNLMPGDIIFVRSNSWVAPLIRLFTRRPHERKTQVNHVAMVVSVPQTNSIEGVTFIEANATGVQWRLLTEAPWKKEEVAIARCGQLGPAQRLVLVERAISYEGKHYGFGKLLAHFGDWALGGKYFFRRLAGSDNYPICSWVVAQAYRQIGIKFGVSANEASPDDIWDWVTNSDPDWEPWTLVRPLKAWNDQVEPNG